MKIIFPDCPNEKSKWRFILLLHLDIFPPCSDINHSLSHTKIPTSNIMLRSENFFLSFVRHKKSYRLKYKQLRMKNECRKKNKNKNMREFYFFFSYLLTYSPYSLACFIILLRWSNRAQGKRKKHSKKIWSHHFPIHTQRT